MGQYAGKCNETGGGNVFLGWGAGHYTTHTYGTFVGHRSGANTTGGQLDVAIGRRAGQGYGQKCCNTFVGSYAGENATSATCNTMLGAAAGRNLTTGDSNVVIGYNVCLPNASDSNCFLLGSGTNRWIYGDSSYNIYDKDGNQLNGGGAGFSPDDDKNLLAGTNAGEDLDGSSGCYNVLIGECAGMNMTSGADNIAIGCKAMGNGVTTGNYNIAFGRHTLYPMTTLLSPVVRFRPAAAPSMVLQVALVAFSPAYDPTKVLQHFCPYPCPARRPIATSNCPPVVLAPDLCPTKVP
jgi:hypothetical protein